ncbi:MAG TPA: RNase adapter RapZ, partial [Gammaproteobacteria bacterium]|nr:RNase adapter RapZ [Gammaproteobacteria bacterium]
MKLTIVSGLSGSGKSVALHTLEDEGFYCIDNLPAGLIPELLERIRDTYVNLYEHIAISLDATSETSSLKDFSNIRKKIEKTGIAVEVVFLHTDTQRLVQRFSETRRRHPLSGAGKPLIKAIEDERKLLTEIAANATLTIDTTQMTLHQLRQRIKASIAKTSAGLSLQFQSFGFKHGAPGDADFLFDVRCLPNPHWDITLRSLTGRDKEVIDFLDAHTEVQDMFHSIRDFLDQWIPAFQRENRAYLTVCIGCTGGQHRSVYLSEKL